MPQTDNSMSLVSELQKPLGMLLANIVAITTVVLFATNGISREVELLFEFQQLSESRLNQRFDDLEGDFANEIGNLKSAISELGDRVLSLEGRIASLEDRVSSLESRIASLEDRVSSLEGRIASLEDRVSSLESRVSSLDDRVSSLESKISSLEASIHVSQATSGQALRRIGAACLASEAPFAPARESV